mmetsp:Transcript_32700/g.43139  ORF Transcript_32700/g.43139 Transcript_32700/m.43139 type:complete len:99 (+) Transcript_32700:303-599(+)
MEILDVAGADFQADDSKQHYKNPTVALYCYSITDQESADMLTKMNLELGFANPIKIIVGLKQDLDAERVVDQTLIAAFAKKFNYKARLETTSTDSANS